MIRMRLKIILLSIHFLASCGFVFGQNSNYFEYYSTVNQAEIFSYDGDFFTSDSLYKVAFKMVDRPFGQDYFLAAINASKMDDAAKTQSNLQNSFALGVEWKQVKGGSMYPFLKEKKLTKKLKKIYKKENEKYLQSLDSELRKKIFLLVEKDQKMRSARNVKKGWQEQKTLLQEADEENFSEILEICKTNGFPGFRAVGENLTSKYDVEDISLLMRHFTEDRLKELKPYIDDAIANGDLYPWHYATAYDYSSMFKTTVDDLDEDGNHILIIQQVYGTMAYHNDKGEMVIYNVENMENIDSLRTRIGLETLIDYAKKREWQLPSEGFYRKVFK